MIPLQHLLHNPAAILLGWSLVHFLWQGVVVALGLAIWLRFTPRSNAQVRYGVAGAAMLVLLACPILTFIVLSQHPQSIDAQTGGISTTTALGQTVSGGNTVAELVAPATSPTLIERLRELAPPDRLLRILVIVWALGVAMLSLRLLAGWLRVQRVRRSGVPVNNRVIRARLNDLSRRMGIHYPVELLESALAHGPAVIGALRPAILFPAAALTGLWPIQIEAILAHELAHIRRHDYLVNLLQSVVETLLFYHPAVWWVSARVREEREHCCDDLAVEACGDRKFYAHCLADLDDLRPTNLELAMGAAGAALLPRIRRILCLPAGDGRAAPATGAALALATTALVVLFTAVPAGLISTARAALAMDDREPVMDVAMVSSAAHPIDPHRIASNNASSNHESDAKSDSAISASIASPSALVSSVSEASKPEQVFPDTASASESPRVPDTGPRAPHVPFPNVNAGALWNGGAWLPRLMPETKRADAARHQPPAVASGKPAPVAPIASDFPPPPPGFGDGELAQRLRELIADASRRNAVRPASSNFVAPTAPSFAVPSSPNFITPTSPNFVTPNDRNFVIPNDPNYVTPNEVNFAKAPSNVARQPSMVNYQGLLFVRTNPNFVSSSPAAAVRPAPNSANAGRQSVTPRSSNAVRPTPQH